MRPRSCVILLTLLLLASAGLMPAAVSADPAPVLSSEGETLTWTPAGQRNVYRLAARVGSERTISTVRGTTVTPPAVPGATVFYRVKAAYNESSWSNAVAITYPAGPTEEPKKEEPAKEEPKKEEAPAGERVGRPNFRIDAASYFDPFVTFDVWIKAHVSMVKAYPPFGDAYVSTGLPVIGYHDAATEGFAPLTAASIESYVSKVKRDAAVGYAGTFLDDINWSLGYRDGSQSQALEPEQEELANLVQAVRAAIPTGLIEINSQYHDIWPLMKAHDPNVERALGSVNIVTKEFGVGPTSGINTAQDYGELFQFVDALHAKGIHVMFGGDHNSATVPTMEYNLATYLLASDGRDFISGTDQTPEKWWPGFDVDLRAATTNRERSPSGVWKRGFTNGVVYTVEPGAATQTIDLGKPMKSEEWGTVESVTLGPGEGAVLHD